MKTKAEETMITKEATKKTLEVAINLDPLTDGIAIITKKDEDRRKGALVVGTNGDSKVISEKDGIAIMEQLYDDNILGEQLGKSPYLAVMNKKKSFTLGEHRYFIGSALVIKYTEDGLDGLDCDELPKALIEFKSRLVTIRIEGQDYAAFEVA